MPLVKINRNFQMTLPKKVRESLQVAVGDYVNVSLYEEGAIIKPMKMVPKEQEYFHTDEWQAKEKEADQDITEKNFSGEFTNYQDLKNHLNNLKNQ